MRTCSECGENCPPAYARPRLTCSPECFTARNLRIRNEQYRQNKPPLRCIDCAGVVDDTGEVRRSVKRCEPCNVRRRRALATARNERKKLTGPVTPEHVWRKRMERDRADPTYARRKLDNRLRSTYGMGADQFDAMAESQNGLCSICGLPPEGRGKGGVLVVDHCHKQGNVRALLCGNCNIAIGLLNDDPEIVTRATEYLHYWSSVESSA